MERQQIPVISIQVSIVVLIVLSFLWVAGGLSNLRDDKYYISIGALTVIFSPVLSQIMYSIWKKYYGFKSYDITKYLIKGSMSGNLKEKIQSLFDNFWHNTDNVNKDILEYSRTRSAVCQMYLFASRIMAIGAMLYLFFIFYYRFLSNIDSMSKSLLLFLFAGLLVYIFDENYKITSRELCRCELINILRPLNKKNYNNFKKRYNNLTCLDLSSQLNKAEKEL